MLLPTRQYCEPASLVELYFAFWVPFGPHMPNVFLINSLRMYQRNSTIFNITFQVVMSELKWTKNSISKKIYGFWAAAPKGTKSCRTRGDFRLSFHPSFRLFVPPQACLSDLKSALSGHKSVL